MAADAHWTEAQKDIGEGVVIICFARGGVAMDRKAVGDA
jgi:hypothetical protein